MKLDKQGFTKKATQKNTNARGCGGTDDAAGRRCVGKNNNNVVGSDDVAESDVEQRRFSAA